MPLGHGVGGSHREAERQQVVQVREVSGDLGPHRQEHQPCRDELRAPAARRRGQPPHRGEQRRAGHRHGRDRGHPARPRAQRLQRARHGQGQRADLQLRVRRVQMQPAAGPAGQQQPAARGEEVPGLAGAAQMPGRPGGRPRPQDVPRPPRPPASRSWWGPGVRGLRGGGPGQAGGRRHGRGRGRHRRDTPPPAAVGSQRSSVITATSITTKNENQPETGHSLGNP